MRLLSKDEIETIKAREEDLNNEFLGKIRNQVSISLQKHNLMDWKFSWNTAPLSAGLCDCDIKTIFLSRDIMLLNQDNELEIMDTILHEIAHAIQFERYGVANHDLAWRCIAREIGCRDTCVFEIGVLRVPEGKYIYQCKSCKRQIKIYKPFKRLHSCKKCDTRYNENYILERVR